VCRETVPSAGVNRAWLLAFAAALVAWALLVLRFDFVCDDAYIAFRYSRHLAEGHGLVFNLGESPPVEGYTNLLWVLWLALFERLGVDVTLAARATSIACGAVLLAVTTHVAVRRFSLALPAAIALALFLACLPPMAMWSTGGLETMAFALAVFAVWERLAGDPDRPRGVQAGICALAAALLRADGALWAAMAIAAAAAARPTERARELRRALLVALAILAAGEAAHLAWRHAVHGEWIPNTARVKAGFSAMRLERGLNYVVAFGLEVLPFLLLPLAAVFRRGLARQAAIFLALAVGYAVFVGGDFMPMGRFLVPAMPFLALILAELAASTRGGVALAGACAVLAILPGFDVHLVPLAVRERFHFRWNQEEPESEVAMWRGMRDRARQWELLGRALAARTEPGDSIVLGNIGAVGYFTELVIFDPFGLVDPEVARRETPPVRASPGHDKRVPFEFFFPRHPTFLSAWLAPADAAPDAALPPAWIAWVREGRAELVRWPLAGDARFPPGVELRALRFR